MLALTTALPLALATAPGHAEPLVIPGSNGPKAVLRALALAHAEASPGAAVVIPRGNGSSRAVRAVQNGEAAVARVSRRPSDAEIHSGLRYASFARDAVVFAVGSGVPMKSLPVKDLQAIFDGRVTNWEHVGGADAPIRVVVREGTASSVMALRRGFPVLGSLNPTFEAKLAIHHHEVLDLLARYKNAIGITTRSHLVDASGGASAIAIDGIEPTVDNLRSGKYPAWVEYGFVWKGEQLPPAARDFVAFIQSPAGEKVLARYGLSAPGAVRP